jgi:hypothetical protein
MTKKNLKKKLTKRKNLTKRKKYNKKTKKNYKKIKYGGNEEVSQEYKQRVIFRRTFYNIISQITNKNNSKNKIKEGITLLINFFNNNKMINTLISVSSNGKFVDKETGKGSIVDFVSPVTFMLDNLSGLSDKDIIRILDAYFKKGGNFNSLSSRFKISPFKNELKKGRINNIKMLLDKSNAFHIYEEGLDEETKIKLAELIPTEQQIITPQKQEDLYEQKQEDLYEQKQEDLYEQKQEDLYIKLELPYILPDNTKGYETSIVPEFWKPIFQNGELLLQIREKFNTIYQLDRYTNDNQKRIKICDILEEIIPSYMTKYTLSYSETAKTLINVNILNCFITLFYGIILNRLYETKQDYLFIFKGGRALQLSLVGIENIEKYFSEDTDILIIPNPHEGDKYDIIKMENLSEHIAYLIKWMIPEEINVIVTLPTNPKNVNKHITKLLYNDKKIFKALSDIGFEEINQDIRKYFDYPSYSPIYIASFEIIALFITPKLDDILSEKLFYYAKYLKLKDLLEKKQPIKYSFLTIEECDYLLFKFKRAILKLVEAIIIRDYSGVLDFHKIDTARLILRGFIGNFQDYTNKEKEDVIISIFP